MITCTGKLQLMEQGQCPCLAKAASVFDLGWVTQVQHSTVMGKDSAVSQHGARYCCQLCP